MTAEPGPKAPRKPHDDRAHKVRTMIRDLIAVGWVPSEVEVDGLRVSLARYEPNGSNATGPMPPTVDEPTYPEVRSHRHRTREDYRRRIQDAGGEA